MTPAAVILRLSAMLAVGITVVVAAPATAEAVEPDARATSALTAERARLRVDLERVNAEIDALKRARGVRDDYKLRVRLADAESLARRLVEIDARLGLRAGSSKTVTAPVAAPTDGPADLDAKADILVDQARRLRTQADSYGKRAYDIKGRQELRRRAADLERDPFAPMETSKRRVASAATTALSTVPRGSNPGPAGQSADIGGGGTPTGGFVAPPTTTPSTPNVTGAGAQTTKTESAVPMPSVQPGQATVDSMRVGGSGTLQDSSLAIQLRDLLDTATLADIRRLEAGRTPTASAQALDRAATALRDRAAELEARARAMRLPARPAVPPTTTH